MPAFLPFKALRPQNEFIEKVSAKSTDFKSKKYLAENLKFNKLSFHHVTKNHLNYSGAYQEPEKFLPFAAKFLDDCIADGVLVQDDQPAYYIYEQKRPDGRRFSGLIGLYNVDDYEKDLIKKHEEVRPNKINFVTQLMRSTKVMGEPILLGYKETEPLDFSSAQQVVSFESVDGKEHSISIISDPEICAKIQSTLTKVDAFYIADGHHRAESVSNYHTLYPSDSNTMSMGLLMEESQFEMNAFHRLIRNIDEISEEAFFEKLKSKFIVEEQSEALYAPDKKGQMGMYKGGKWYKLTYSGDSDAIDIEILEEEVVKSIFGILDSRTDSQISFHPETAGLAKLIKLVDNDTFRVAFTLKPCEFRDVRHTADKGETMPPKSTFIEPKLRAGMIIKKF